MKITTDKRNKAFTDEQLENTPSVDFLDHEAPTLCELCGNVECECKALMCMCGLYCEDCVWPNGENCYCLKCAKKITRCTCEILK